jgi:hypothetical protein
MTWKCSRQQNGQRCGHINENRHTLCRSCGKRRPARKSTADRHRAARDAMNYDELVKVMGERCWICGAKPKGRRLHRDHDHRQAIPRGLLCFPCNSALRPYMTLDWLRRAVRYLERFEEPASGVHVLGRMNEEAA